MKKIFSVIAATIALAGCTLDYVPLTDYTEGIVENNEETGNLYSVRADMEGLRNSIYESWFKDIQECGFSDLLIMSECRADNAYCGTSTPEIMDLEANKQDATNKNTMRDWTWYLGQVSNANTIIYNIDNVFEADAAWTDTDERDEWRSEALCWRAYCWWRLAQMYGGAPMVLGIPETITSENVEKVYPLYYPAKNSKEEIFTQIIEDMTYAAAHAPAVDPSNKCLFTKGFAHGMMARIYAEDSSLRDWSKCKAECEAVEAFGYSLEPNYGDLWGYDEDDAFRNSCESICEVQWTNKSAGNWVFMMFHRNYYVPADSYTWAKWVTPARNFAAAFDKAGDTVRKNACMITDACSWENYYPAGTYVFMHKMPTNINSIYLMRLGEIYLLHAEALAGTDDLAGATTYVNKVRKRAGLADAAVPSSKDAAIDMILDERRFELAFEGFRFFDLCRYGLEKVKAVHDAYPNDADPYFLARTPMDESHMVVAIPQTQIDNNPNLSQNFGY